MVYEKIAYGLFSGRIYMKIEFSSQRREMLLFLITNMAAVASHSTQQLCENMFMLAVSRNDHLIISANHIEIKYIKI